MEKYAYFLPQYHEIPENNVWWGKGFTEWDNIRNCKPLFQGHNQQFHPLNNNYYNLLDKKTVVWQTELLDQFHIDGFIYYHYYFKGKKLLERPAEQLLEWTKINQRFFFCWANHDWVKKNGRKKMLLMKQEYGSEKDWEEHFQYLLPFFQDSRYVKNSNKPLFLLHNPIFPEKKDMMNYFNQRCRDAGFDGLYLIETYQHMGRKGWDNNYKEFRKNMADCAERVHIREHNTSMQIRGESVTCDFWSKSVIRISKIMNSLTGKTYIHRMSADRLYKIMLEKEPNENFFIKCLFFGWDNTPRYGEKGSVIYPPSKQMLDQFMNKVRNNDYLFINAWNEWGEGMVLEPSEEEGYKYLEYLKKW